MPLVTISHKVMRAVLCTCLILVHTSTLNKLSINLHNQYYNRFLSFSRKDRNNHWLWLEIVASNILLSIAVDQKIMLHSYHFLF